MRGSVKSCWTSLSSASFSGASTLHSTAVAGSTLTHSVNAASGAESTVNRSCSRTAHRLRLPRVQEAICTRRLDIVKRNPTHLSAFRKAVRTAWRQLLAHGPLEWTHQWRLYACRLRVQALPAVHSPACGENEPASLWITMRQEKRPPCVGQSN